MSQKTVREIHYDGSGALFFYKIRFNKLRTAQFEPEIMRVIPCGLDTDVVFREKWSFYRTQVRMMHINSTIYMSESALPFDTRPFGAALLKCMIQLSAGNHGLRTSAVPSPPANIYHGMKNICTW